MAKPKAGTLAKQGTQALARPAFITEGDQRGTENITTKDIRPPALRIAQSMSPQTKKQNMAYIEGLTEGELFNSMTNQVYGEDAVEIVVINQLGARHVEFAPMDEGGGVLDFNVPDGDPRTEFTSTTVDGVEKRVKPRATKFYDYLIVLLHGGDVKPELMTLSMKSTALKVATKLNTLLLTSKLPSFSMRFKLGPVPDTRGTYNFYNWRLDPAGWVDEETFDHCSALYDQLSGKDVSVSREGDGDTSAAAPTTKF